MRKESQGTNTGGHKEHGGTVLTGCNAGTAADTLCGIHRLVIPDQIEEIDNFGIGVLFNCRYVEFGLGLKYLGSGNLYGYGNLDTIRFRSPQPPKVTATTFSFVKERPNPLVLVPAEALERYKADTNFAKLNIKGY